MSGSAQHKEGVLSSILTNKPLNLFDLDFLSFSSGSVSTPSSVASLVKGAEEEGEDVEVERKCSGLG